MGKTYFTSQQPAFHMEDDRKHYLHHIHEFNRHTELQDEPPVYQTLAAHGYPYIAEYLHYRRFFDSLPYASGAGKRFYSYEDKNNYSEYHAPCVTTKCLEGDQVDMDLLQEQQAAGWLEAEPGEVISGYWQVSTEDELLRQALSRSLNRGIMHSPARRVYHFSLTNPNRREFDLLLGIIDEYHKQYVLERRQPPLPGGGARKKLLLSELEHLAGCPDAWI